MSNLDKELELASKDTMYQKDPVIIAYEQIIEAQRKTIETLMAAIAELEKLNTTQIPESKVYFGDPL